MKKILAFMLAALMIVATFSACSDGQNDEIDDADKYLDNTVVKTYETIGDDTFHFETIDSETVTITDFSSANDAPHAVTIPAYVDITTDENGEISAKRVVAISTEAFCYKSNINRVIFPSEADYKEYDADFDIDTFEFSVGNYAFRDCVVLTAITLPAYITELGTGAFYGCTGLEVVAFEEGSRLEEVKAYTFMECTSLKAIKIPGSAVIIGQAACYGCTALQSVILEEGVSLVIAQAFQDCDALASISLPSSLDSIGTYAFHGSDALYAEGLTYEGDSEEILAYIASLRLESANAN